MSGDTSPSGGFLEIVRTLDLRAVEEAARGVAPGLFPATVAPLGEGMDHRAFLVGADHVFRFPKHRHAAGMMEVELRLLPGLSARLDLPIPRYEQAGRLTDGTPFVGYRLIRGEELTPELVASLTVGERSGLASDFAGFLGALHASPLEEARTLGVREIDARPDLREELDRARSVVFPRVDEASRRFVERRFAGYLAAAENFAYEPALIHCDLCPEHVLYDPAAGRLAGVIDFDFIIGDPDLDLIYPAWAGFLEDVLAHDPHPDETSLRRKVEFYGVREVVVDACWAIQHRDGASIAEQLSLLERQARG